MPLLFLDLETTGLDPDHGAVLEVAAVVVPDNLIGWSDEWRLAFPTFHSVIAWDPTRHIGPIDPYVVAMHARNGLWKECLAATQENYEPAHPYSMVNVDDRLCMFMQQHARNDPGRAETVTLAGNSVHFDRAFMRQCFPRAFAELHHRQLDVSSINELARRCWPDVYAGRPKGPEGDSAHRALADVDTSIATMRYYTAALGPGYDAPSARPS